MAAGSRSPKTSDRLALNVELAVLDFDGTLESSVDRIILEHIDLGPG